MSTITYRAYDEEFENNENPNANFFNGIFSIKISNGKTLDILVTPFFDVYNLEKEVENIKNSKIVSSEQSARAWSIARSDYNLVVNGLLKGSIQRVPSQVFDYGNPQNPIIYTPIVYFISEDEYQFLKSELLDSEMLPDYPENESFLNAKSEDEFRYLLHKSALDSLSKIADEFYKVSGERVSIESL
jgi:hypothetical protein